MKILVTGKIIEGIPCLVYTTDKVEYKAIAIKDGGLVKAWSKKQQ